MKTKLKSVLLLSFLFLCVACNEVAIVHDLNERDANEILVLLAKNEITALKEQEIKNQEVFWVIKVNTNDQIKSQSILVANHLPRAKKGGLKGYCKEADMIVTEKFEKCQSILAQKEEIINALESIPGVVSADVVLNIPDKEEFLDENAVVARPTAAVTLKYLVDANVKTTLSEDKIQEFVANAVQDLDPRDVQVIMSYLEQAIDQSALVAKKDEKKNDQVSETVVVDVENGGGSNGSSEVVAAVVTENADLVSVAGIKMEASAAKKFKIVAGLFLVLLLALAGAFIFALMRLASLRKKGANMTAPVPVNEANQKLAKA